MEAQRTDLGEIMADQRNRLEPLKGEDLEMDNQQGDHTTGLNGENSSDPTKRHTVTTVSQVPSPPFQKLANPGPLGLIGFAVTTFVLGLYQCGAG